MIHPILLSVSRILLKVSPYCVVAVLFLAALIVLIRHFRAGRSAVACCSTGESDHPLNPCSQTGRYACASCPFSGCTARRQSGSGDSRQNGA